jgi:CARDB protein
MTDYEDERIEFDFFDEPETEEAPRPRRRQRKERSGGPRPPQPPTGLVPLARLVGLIALAIAIIVAFVFWIGACQGKSKHDEYASYAARVRTVAASSNALGREFASKLVSSTKQSDLETSIQQYAQQEQQEYDQAQQIRAPGPLRQIHQQLVDAIELRAKGLAGLGGVIGQWNPKSDSSTAATPDALAAQAQLLVASDVVWQQLYGDPAMQELRNQNVTGVVIPKSAFVPNTELVSARSFGVLLQHLKGASTGGTPSGLHGSQLISTVANPGPTPLSTTTATTVKVSADLAFVVTVEDSGNFQETGVAVHLRINAGSAIIKRTQTIELISPKAQQTVTFSNFNLPTSAFGNKATVKVDVAPVPGETNLTNNSATYTVFFTLG